MDNVTTDNSIAAGSLTRENPDNTNVRVEDPDETCYDMKTSPKGRFVLINQRDFSENTDFYKKPRMGTDEDAKALENLFTEIGFQVERYDNKNAEEVRKIFKDVQKNVKDGRKYPNVSCFACAILTHGEDGGVIWCTDKEIPLKVLADDISHANHLVGKPKFFIVQACRGGEAMDPIDYNEADASDPNETLTLPLHADFLFAYSTAPGFASFRHPEYGSWFVQELVDVFRQQAHKLDVVKMLTRVNYRIAAIKAKLRKPDEPKTKEIKCQIPSITSQLRKDFYLMPSMPL